MSKKQDIKRLLYLKYLNHEQGRTEHVQTGNRKAPQALTNGCYN